MRVKINLNTFRKLARAEEAMIRSVMPRVSAADPVPVGLLALQAENSRKSARTLTVTLREVARG